MTSQITNFKTLCQQFVNHKGWKWKRQLTISLSFEHDCMHFINDSWKLIIPLCRSSSHFSVITTKKRRIMYLVAFSCGWIALLYICNKKLWLHQRPCIFTSKELYLRYSAFDVQHSRDMAPLMSHANSVTGVYVVPCTYLNLECNLHSNKLILGFSLCCRQEQPQLYWGSMLSV